MDLVKETIDFMDEECFRISKIYEHAMKKPNVKQEELDRIKEKLNYYNFAIFVMKRVEENSF